MVLVSNYLSEVLANNLKYGYCKPKIMYGPNPYNAESDIVITTISDKVNNAANAVMNFVRR